MQKRCEIDDDDEAFLNSLVAKSRPLVGGSRRLGLASSSKIPAACEFAVTTLSELCRQHDDTGLPVHSPGPSISRKQRLYSPMSLVKSKQRVADHGEVFTPQWLVEAMLDLVKGETERIDARFLEPACGSGNFLVPILKRKLAAVELKFGKSDFEKRQYALLAVMCTYGIELLADNITECRANTLEVLADYLNLDETDDLYRAASYVLSQNLVHGNALTMRTPDGGPITFAEWGYLGKGKFQRRDFRLDVLTSSSGFREEGSLFAHLGKHEIFKPAKDYAPMTMREIAAGLGNLPEEAA